MFQAVWEVFVCRQKIERGNQAGEENLADDCLDYCGGGHYDDRDDDRDQDRDDDHDNDQDDDGNY